MSVDQELLLRNEYLATENRILRVQIKGPLKSRRVALAGPTLHPNESWSMQIAKNVTMDQSGFLEICRNLIHDRDTRFTGCFHAIIRSSDVEALRLPARNSNLNAYTARWVKPAKDECLSKLILIGEASLRRALQEYVTHFHRERNSQGKDNVLLLPLTCVPASASVRPDRCRQRLGGLLNHSHREAA